MQPAAAPGGYKDLVLFLAMAGVVVPVFKRLRISPVLGFLGAGVVLGPHGLARFASVAPWIGAITVARPAEVAEIAEFGVVFLLFMIGLELSWERLRLMRRLVFGLGAAQVILTAAAVALAAGFAGQDLTACLTIGAALALSSTAIVMPVLAEHKRLRSDAGRATFAILLFQDMAVAPIVVTLGVVGASKAGFDPRLLLSFTPAVLGLAALVVVGRLVLRPMMKSVVRAKSEEMFMAACLLVVIGAGLVSALAGLSMAIGAFIAGLLLAETEYRHEIEVTIEPFKGLLLGLFFVSVGIELDLSRLAAHPLPILGVTLGLMGVKTAVTFLASRGFGMRSRVAGETALALAAGGEFAFVILNAAMLSGAVAEDIGQSVLIAASLTMFAIPALGALGARLGRTGASSPVPVEADPAPKSRVLVIGYGRVGRIVGEMLSRHDLVWAAVDRDPREVEAARRAGHEVFFGDAGRPEFLRRLGIEAARGLVVTMDSPAACEAVVIAARAVRPDLTIVARARDARHAQRLYDLGATDVVPEAIEASLQLSEAVLVGLGAPMGLVIASIHERRDEYRKQLNRPDAPSGKIRRARDAMRPRKPAPES